ncbi:MAG: hypothetical protein CVT75_03475 [Alphaproteobacteria bacterium HGW-Alphaproteobacteria-14]|nr:MAG: hypothetical protein CVT75_03475 [Alphaproteobacteria bacterium HGW-Alphaproteobacteria-14]
MAGSLNIKLRDGYDQFTRNPGEFAPATFPLLLPETAWGGDLGYEHKIGKTGVIGVNLFYRDVSNLTEIATVLDTGGAPVEGSEGPGTFVFTPRNTGSGEVYGIEFGATYRKQGEAFGRVVAREVFTRYGGDLEVFIEKRFGDSFTIRAVGSNLLDSTKDEDFNKFNTVQEQIDRDFDEFELESERAGPVFQIVARYAF